MRICVVGCGAVGSLFAAHLATLEDVEVWAYDLDRAHVDAINKDGLRLVGAGERPLASSRDRGRSASCRPATSGSSRPRRCTRTPRSPLWPTRSREGAVASVQNGVGNEEVIAGHVERVIRGTTFPAGKLLEPGVVQWDVKGDTTLRAVRAQPGERGGDRAPGRRVYPRRHAGARGRATPGRRSGGR